MGVSLDALMIGLSIYFSKWMYCYGPSLSSHGVQSARSEVFREVRGIDEQVCYRRMEHMGRDAARGPGN